MGVSGGAISNAVLTLYGQPMQRAVATSAGIGVPITIAGTIGYMLAGWPHMAQLPPLSIGFVSVIGFVLMAPVSSYTASYGVRLAHWLPRRKLEIAFGMLPLSWLRCALLVSLNLAAGAHGLPRMRSRSPRTSQLSSRLRKVMPSRLFLS